MASKVLFQPVPGKLGDVRVCFILLKPERCYKRRIESLFLTFEGIQNFNMSFFGDCHCYAWFFKKLSPTMPLAKIASHTVHLWECRGMVTTLLDLEVPQNTFVFELTFLSKWKWVSFEVQRRLGNAGVSSFLWHLDCHSLYLLFVGACKGLLCLYSVWASLYIVY